MKTVLHFINWNDSYYLPFIKKHYGTFCHKIVMYDQHSTDGSVHIAKHLGFEIRTFGHADTLNDQWYLDVKNNCWKEQRGKCDYVIVCDVDEFLVIDNLKGTLPVVHGYNMISDDLPKHDIFEVSTGAESENYSKQVIFSPDHIEEINFVHGCHRNNVRGNLVRSGHCRLFHYRQIGGVQRIIDRHSVYRARLSKFNLKHNMGHHYGRPEMTEDEIQAFNNQKKEEWTFLQQQARKLW